MIALRQACIPQLLLAAAVLIAFGTCLTAEFHFDDYSLFSDAAVASASGWRDVWRPAQTRPLTYFTFWVNHALGGRNPTGYHAVNLALHLAAVLLLYGILSRLMPGRAALIGAAIFALHPVQTEPVVYIFARATLLATLLCLVSARCWIQGRRWAAAGWFAAALVAKEECAAFPVFLLLLNLATRRKLTEWKPIAVMLGLAVAAGLRVIVVLAQAQGSGAGPGSSVSPMEYLATQGTVILRYFRLLLIPVGFSIDPDISVATGWKAALAWAVILAMAGLALRRFTGAREGFWFLAGLILLAPSSSVFPADDLAADRRLYLPMVAFSAAAGMALKRFSPRAVSVAGLLLVGLTVGRVQVWQTGQSLWEDALRKAPGKVRPKVQLARVVDRQRSLRLLEEAKSLAPDDAAVASEMGKTYLALERPRDALAEFGRALALTPRDPLAFNNRGVALLALGQAETASKDFERALEADPCAFDARFNLLQLGVRTEAPESCRYSDEQRHALKNGKTGTDPTIPSNKWGLSPFFL